MQSGIALKLFGGCILACAISTLCWSQGETALPEFFGFYALDHGRHVAIYEGQGSESGKSVGINWYSIPQNTKQQDTRQEISTSSRFVLFYSNSGEMIQSLSLYKLPYVRNIVETFPASGFAPASRQTVDSPKVPLLAGIPELSFKLLAKPVLNQPQMVELVPNPMLTPGLYVVQYSPSGGNGWFAIFPVDTDAELQNPFCLDLILPGGPRGLFERANSELNSTVPTLPSYRYSKCDSSAILNAGTAAGVSSDEGNAGEGGLNELISTWDRALAQGREVSIPMCRDGSGFANKCETGTLSLSPQEVSFVKTNGQKVFTVLPPQIKYRRDPNMGGGGVFTLTGGGKYTRLLYLAQGVDCPGIQERFPVCPAEGMNQQNIVSDWVQKALVRLASSGSK